MFVYDKECPLYTILVLSLICYMGINNRLPYRIMTIFEIYKEKVILYLIYIGIE